MPSLAEISANANNVLQQQGKVALAGSQYSLGNTTRVRNPDGSLSNPNFPGGQAPIKGEVGSNGTGQVAFTGDSTYMDQVNAINNARANSIANLNAQRQGATQQYDWNKQDLNRESGVDQYNMVNDFASRGVLNSGLYAKSEDDRSAGITRRQQAMAMALQNQLSGFDSQQSQFNSESEVALNRAKADAAARQAAKIGIG